MVTEDPLPSYTIFSPEVYVLLTPVTSPVPTGSVKELVVLTTTKRLPPLPFVQEIAAPDRFCVIEIADA